MRQRVELSSFSVIMTTLGLVILIGALLFAIFSDAPVAGVIFLAVLLTFVGFAALFYAPLSISVDNRELNVNRCWKAKTIPLSEIESVKLCPPTMAERRLCGSGGWFGYWGWFSEPSIGKYFAYYGKASDCFLVRLKDGRQYILGCENPKDMVAYLSSKIR
ncbi:MAG: PH domain-containing protein [Muribaculaceae bacterium]|nr:PH domain-containing protein [Muribaculaceae bacterium]